MNTKLDQIIEQINDAISAAASPPENIKMWGLARIMTKHDQEHPVQILGDLQISIDNRFDAIIYHRIISSDTETKEDQSFGRTTARASIIRIRTVIANKKHLGEMYKYDVVQRIPERLTIEGLKYVDISPDVSMNENDDEVYEELGGSDYEKRTAPWIISAAEYDVEFLSC